MTEKARGWRPVYRVVRRIPVGEVATYGQIAALSGMPRAARQVGWALSALAEDDDVPWHRVINAQGEISPRGGPEIVDLQRSLLESEGVEFDRRDRVDLDRYCWVPGRRKATRVKARTSPRNAEAKLRVKTVKKKATPDKPSKKTGRAR